MNRENDDNESRNPSLGWDHLLAACQKNQPELVRSLVEVQGVNPSHANRIGQSALHIAALWGHVECVEILLDFGADVHTSNQITGATPLHCAIQSSRLQERTEVVKLLLEKGGANPALKDLTGRVPLDYLRPDEIEGTDLSQLLQPNIPPIFKAICENNIDKVKDILESTSTDDVSPSGRSIFVERYKSKTPSSTVIDRLIEHVEQEDEEVCEKTLQILEVMTLNNRFSIIDSDALEDNPFHQICLAFKQRLTLVSDDKINNDKLAKILRSAAELLYNNNNDKDTILLHPETKQLLHDSARRGKYNMAVFLLETIRIDPNTKGRQGMTPLQFAARSGKTDIVKYLLSNYDIDHKITDDRGQTALDAAISNKREDIITLLRTAKHHK